MAYTCTGRNFVFVCLLSCTLMYIKSVYSVHVMLASSFPTVLMPQFIAH